MPDQPITFLRNLWYCAGRGDGLKPGAMRHRTLLGEPILLGRDHAGTAFALRDLCPHRGVLLSAGRIRPAGNGQSMSEVECAYHGWRFGIDGACRAIPSLTPDQKLDVGRIRVRAYPVQERQGLLWIFMAVDQNAREAPAMDPPEVPLAGAEAGPQLVEAMTFHCDVDHAVIGLMDPAHGPFVHRSWWWRKDSSIHEKAKAFHPSTLGFTMTSHTPSRNSGAYKLLGGKPTTEIAFRLPGIRIETIRAGRNFVVGLTTVTPINADDTEVCQYFYWSMPWLTLLKPFLRPFARQFLGQDRSMVDLQAKGLKYNPRLMLIDDADTQAKWYYSLRRQWESAQAEGRPFTHPIREATVLRWRS
jgi:phenylpropionate dioxygenase-like ring-hydroxylating dioxygenase large terminal subunit